MTKENIEHKIKKAEDLIKFLEAKAVPEETIEKQRVRLATLNELMGELNGRK